MPPNRSRQAPRFWLLFLLATHCANDETHSAPATTEPPSNGGSYTGLEPFVSVSGSYGIPSLSNGGDTSRVSTSTNTIGTSTPGTSLIGSGGTLATTSNGGSVSIGGSASSIPVGGSSSFLWPTQYDANGSSPLASGKHNPGMDCMTSSCHGPTQGSRAFAFGGTVYTAAGVVAPHVQIAIVTAQNVFTTYSGTNGNFWLPLSDAVNIEWAKATVYLRNGAGEISKPSTATVNSNCNGCHGSSKRMIGP
jgi:hypothetical protein